MFALAHKYGASELEGKARTLAIALTRPNVIREHLDPSLTAMRIMELGREVDCSELAESAWEIISEDFRAHKIPMHEVLSFADRVCTPQGAALAYYDAMLRGFGVWNFDTLLSDKQKQALATGTASCSHSMDKLITTWLSGSDYPAHVCSHPPADGNVLPGCQHRLEWVASCLKNSAINGLPSSDILGRLGLAAQLPPPSSAKGKPCSCSRCRAAIQPCKRTRAAPPRPPVTIPLSSDLLFTNDAADGGALTDAPAGTEASPDNTEASAWLTMTCSEVACALAQKVIEEQKQHLEQHFQLGLVDMGSPASSFSNLSAPETHATGV